MYRGGGNDGWTLLHFVAFNNSFTVLPYILSLHPKAIDVRSEKGEKPIDVARRYNSVACLKLLQFPDKTVQEAAPHWSRKETEKT